MQACILRCILISRGIQNSHRGILILSLLLLLGSQRKQSLTPFLWHICFEADQPFTLKCLWANLWFLLVIWITSALNCWNLFKRRKWIWATLQSHGGSYPFKWWPNLLKSRRHTFWVQLIMNIEVSEVWHWKQSNSIPLFISNQALYWIICGLSVWLYQSNKPYLKQIYRGVFPQRLPSNSTSKVRVAFGGITPPAPFAPYANSGGIFTLLFPPSYKKFVLKICLIDQAELIKLYSKQYTVSIFCCFWGGHSGSFQEKATGFWHTMT